MTAADIATTWPQADARDKGWVEAEYYEQGPVAVLTGPDGRTATVVRTGHSRVVMTPSHPVDDDDTLTLTTAHDFRDRFPDGTLPDDEEPEFGATTYAWHGNGWFVVLDAAGDETGDGVSHSLAEALADAERVLGKD